MRVFFVFAVAVGLLIYSTGLWAPYHLDDPSVIGSLNSTAVWSLGHVRALGYFSFWLNRQIMLIIGSVLPWREPFYYRIVNVFIHALAATALFGLVRELTERWQLAAVAGSLFLVHPIQTQAVTYISQRFESQAAMFMFLAAAAYVRFRRTTVKWWIAPTVLFAIAAALTKETAVILPVWLLLIELVFFEGAQLRKYAVYMAGIGVILLIPAVRAFEQDSHNLFGWIAWDRYFLTQGPILTKYFELATWPRRQFLFYDFQPVTAFTWQVALQWLLVLAVAGSGVYLLKWTRSASAIARNRGSYLMGFGILSFFILLLPVMVLPLPDLIFEHRLYGAFAGVAIALAGCVQAINRKWAIAAVGILVVLFGVKTAKRNSDWNDQLQFLEMHRAAFPQDPQILTRLASYDFTSGYVNKSIELNLEARRYQDRLNNYYSQQGQVLTAINLAAAYLAKNDLRAAELEARRAIAAKPNEPYAWRMLGFIQLDARQPQKAVESFRKYAELSPGIDAWQGLQTAAARAGDQATAKLAAEKLKIEEDKAAAEQATVVQIPDRYKSYVIFGITLALLFSVAWAVWTVWCAAMPLLRTAYVQRRETS